MVREGLLEAPGLPQAEPEAALEVGVDVAEDADSFGSSRVELAVGHLFDVEELLEAGSEGLLPGGGVGQPRDQAVRREDGKAWILEGDERHQDVIGWAVLAHLALIGERRFVAV